MRRQILGIFLLAGVAAFSPAALAQTGGPDLSGCSVITGWASGPGESTITVDLSVIPSGGTETYVTSAVANQYRSDGHGYHGFTIPLPDSINNGLNRTLLVRSGGLLLFSLSGVCYPSGGYQYYLPNNFDAARWTQNGSISLGGKGLTATSASGGSWISNVAVPDGSSDYEVRMTLNLAASGGTYAAYLRASSNAMAGPSAQGTYYSVELQNPAFTGNNCSATLAINMRTGGTVTMLDYNTVPCRRETVMRVVRNPTFIVVWLDGVAYLWNTNTTIAAGAPGVGGWAMPAGNSITRADLGPIDRTAPSPINLQSLGISAPSNSVDVEWQNASDGPSGVGAAFYQIYRNGAFIKNVEGPNFNDSTVAPGTTYTYTVHAVDYHFNFEAAANTTFTVNTPPAGSIDPLRVGVRPTGAYWGAGGEQIDTRSGNLNFALPLLRAEGRGGWGVPFALSYNSQMWRQESGRDWKAGDDVGYGIGWRLQAGSITPYWDGMYVHHYVFTDSTGAEYRLDLNTNGIWTSRDGVYVEYEPSTYRLYFPDGTFCERYVKYRFSGTDGYAAFGLFCRAA